MENMVQDGTYKKLKNDPTQKITKGLNQMLRKLETPDWQEHKTEASTTTESATPTIWPPTDSQARQTNDTDSIIH